MSASHTRCSVEPLSRGGPLQSGAKDLLPLLDNQGQIQVRFRVQSHVERFYASLKVQVELRRLCRQRHIHANRSNQKVLLAVADCLLESLKCLVEAR